MSLEPTYSDPRGTAADPLLPQVDTPLTGGFNLRVHPRHLQQSQAADLVGVDLDDPSKPRTRDGYVEPPIGTVGVSDASERLARLAALETGPSSKLLVRVTPAGGTWVTFSPDDTLGWGEALVTANPDGLHTGTRFSPGTERVRAFGCNDQLWIVPQGGSNVHVLQIDGMLVDAGNLETSPPRSAVDGCAMVDRAWLLTRKELHWSKLSPAKQDLLDGIAFDRKEIPDDSAVAGFLRLSGNGTSEPVAVRPWRGQVLIIAGTSQFEQVVVNASDPLFSQRSVIEPEFGCSSADTLIPLGDEFYFLDQYGEFRSLRRTISDENAGVGSEPISEAISPILKIASLGGRLTEEALWKAWAIRLGKRIYLTVPIDGESEPRHCFVFNTARRVWESHWDWAEAMHSPTRSTIRGGVQQVFAASATDGRVYQLFAGSYSDNGAEIDWRVDTAAMDGGRYDAFKRPHWMQVTRFGSVGASMEVFMRTGDNMSFEPVETLGIDTNAGSFPLVAEDFPLVPADFPLTATTPRVTTSGFEITEAPRFDGPLDGGEGPLFSHDEPLYGGMGAEGQDGTGGGVPAGPYVQVRFESRHAGKVVDLLGWRLASHVEVVDKQESEP